VGAGLINHKGTTATTEDKMHEPIPIHVEEIATKVMDSAFAVHRALGPGLLESVYESCMCHELSKAGVPFQRQLSLAIVYDTIKIDGGLRLDLLVDQLVICELKAVEKILPIHEAQILTYLKLSNLRLGFILNFNVALLKDGIRRIAR
jgi:GxxExxY protein